MLCLVSMSVNILGTIFAITNEMKNMKIVYALVFGIVLGGCASKKIQAPKELTWEVADTFIPCEGVSAQNCIQVREQ